MIALLLSSLLMHPFHVSITEAQWNAESKCFELAMRLDPRDFSQAIARQEGQRLNLEKASEKQLEEVTMRYLNRKFKVQDTQQRKAAWRFVGLENETRYVWVYVELKPHSESKQLELTNTMLVGVAPSQVNTILLTRGRDKQTLQFSKAKTKQTLLNVDGRWQVKADAKAAPAKQ